MLTVLRQRIHLYRFKKLIPFCWNDTTTLAFPRRMLYYRLHVRMYQITFTVFWNILRMKNPTKPPRGERLGVISTLHDQETLD